MKVFFYVFEQFRLFLSNVWKLNSIIDLFSQGHHLHTEQFLALEKRITELEEKVNNLK